MTDTRNRWERLRDLPPAEEAASHFSDADDPLDIEDLICAGCQGDWPCDFERGRRSALADEGYVVVRAEDVRDADRWRAAEAEGHVVDFSDTGYGLQHPPSCRPNLIGCLFNAWLADLGEPAMPPGRYRIGWDAKHGGDPTYAALAAEGYVVVRAEDVRTVGPLVAALTDALPNRSRDAILALGDLLRDEHGESCDCETCLPVQSLVDTALREALEPTR